MIVLPGVLCDAKLPLEAGKIWEAANCIGSLTYGEVVVVKGFSSVDYHSPLTTITFTGKASY